MLIQIGFFYFYHMDEKMYELFLNSSGVCTDTRAIEKDTLFVCIKGDNFDGNTFAKGALEKGAKHVIVDNPAYCTDPKNMTVVENSVTFLQNLALHHRKQFNIPIIGITGSNGKTTTKELINAVLSKKYNVLSTKGNLNNHLGVPFTLLQLNKQHEIAIIEMGANKFKDIEELCAIALPNYGIITNIGKAHLEGFIDHAGVIKTKRELYEALDLVENGTIIINEDDELLKEIVPAGPSRFTYGTSNESNVVGELVDLSPFVEMRWEFKEFKSSVVSTQMVGKYNFYNYLSAIAFGLTFGVDYKLISEAISEYTPTNNRSQVKKTSRNSLILDCYNANPTSMKSALESFAMIENPNKLCILGDMKELGVESSVEHKAIINLLEDLKLKAYTVGKEFKEIKSSAVLHAFETSEDCKNHLESEQQIANQLILLKGSRSIQLEILENSL